MKRKVLFILVLCFAVGALVLGCGSREGGGAENGSHANAEEVCHFTRSVNPEVEGIDEGMMDVIDEYYKRLYSSMAELKVHSAADLFASDEYAYMTDTSFKYLVETRKLAVNDLSISEYNYDLIYDKITLKNEMYIIEVRESCKINFKGFPGVTSEQSHILGRFYLIENGDSYKIYKVNKEESFAILFYKDYVESPEYRDVIDALYEKHFGNYKAEAERLEEDRAAANSGLASYTPIKCDVSYDRAAAIAYSERYWNDRNGDYYGSTSNCQNFVSQCMHAGGIEFDKVGGSNQKWYNNGKNSTYSFKAIGYFKKYLASNVGAGMRVQLDVNLFLAEPGDMIHVTYIDREHANHTVLVSKVVRDEAGNATDILVNGNTNDQHNFPASAMGYPWKVLLKVDGYMSK